MKKPINIIGLILIFFLLLGVIAKRLHLPGASIFLVTGIFFFILVYLPFYISWIYRAMKKTDLPSNKFIAILTIAGIILLCFGSLFKIMHWPGAAIGVWVGLVVICIGLTIFLIQNRKVFFESLSMISVLLAILILGGFSFNFTHLKQFRRLSIAEETINPVYSESSDQIKKYCTKELQDFYHSAMHDSSHYNELMLIHNQALMLDENLEKKINELRSYVAEAEVTGASYDEMMSTINSMIFRDNFIVDLDEDLNHYREALYAFQMNAGLAEVKLEKYFISDPDYTKEDLRSRYFGSVAIYEGGSITALEIWRNRIWRAFYSLENSILSRVLIYPDIIPGQEMKLNISLSLKSYLT